MEPNKTWLWVAGVRARYATQALGLVCGLCGGVLTFATLNALHHRDAEQRANSVVAATHQQVNVAAAPIASESESQVLDAPPASYHDIPAPQNDDAADDDVPPPTVRSPFTVPVPATENRNVPPPSIAAAPPPPPTVQPTTVAASEPSTVNADSAAPRPEWTTVNVDVSVEPKEASIFRRMAEHVPSLAGHVPVLGRPFRRESKEIVAPRPTAGLKPQIPQSVSKSLRDPIEVDVEASIDNNGYVRNAEVTRGAATDFAELVERKVRSVPWRPAHAGTRNVAMDVVVHYRFDPARDR